MDLMSSLAVYPFLLFLISSSLLLPRIRERKESVTVLLCGTSGCGKSTLSSLLVKIALYPRYLHYWLWGLKFLSFSISTSLLSFGCLFKFISIFSHKSASCFFSCFLEECGQGTFLFFVPWHKNQQASNS